MKQVLISRGGQISIPAVVRHRWKTDRVLLDDRGDVLVVRPLPDDPIAAARGIFASATRDTMASDEARRRTRDEESAARERRR